MKLFSKKHISTYPDEQLIPLIVKKNEKAFEEVYNRYSKKMYYFFLVRFNFDKDLANDLLQDLFIKLIDQAEKFETSHQFSTWFYTMANNNCKNEYKRVVHSLEKVTEEEKISIVDESSVYDLNLNEDFYNSFKYSLENELKRLKPSHRTTFVLKYKEDLTIKAIARIMDCSEGTIKSRLHYTVKSLAQSLAKYNTNKKTNEIEVR
jgi:RNA polymerase sigma-70 factor (ECF subfamily)